MNKLGYVAAVAITLTGCAPAGILLASAGTAAVSGMNANSQRKEAAREAKVKEEREERAESLARGRRQQEAETRAMLERKRAEKPEKKKVELTKLPANDSAYRGAASLNKPVASESTEPGKNIKPAPLSTVDFRGVNCSTAAKYARPDMNVRQFRIHTLARQIEIAEGIRSRRYTRLAKELSRAAYYQPIVGDSLPARQRMIEKSKVTDRWVAHVHAKCLGF